MNNKLTKPLLRVWLSLASIAAFVTGWAALSHAPKPTPLAVPVVQVTVPDLPPVPDLQELRTGRRVTVPSISVNPSFGFPRLRARGS